MECLGSRCVGRSDLKGFWFNGLTIEYYRILQLHEWEPIIEEVVSLKEQRKEYVLVGFHSDDRGLTSNSTLSDVLLNSVNYASVNCII